jgi:hypothetical protein
MSLRPALPVRGRRAIWATVCAAIGGAVIIHSDGVDFKLLEPTALAIAMFIAIPAAGAWLMAYLVDRWDPWWTKNWRRTAIASIAILPVAIGGIGIVVGLVIVAAAVIASVTQIRVLHRVARHVVLRGAVCLGLAALTTVAIVDLSGDVTTLL